MGSYIQIYLQDAPGACDVEIMIPEVLSWKCVFFWRNFCNNWSENKTILELTRSSHKLISGTDAVACQLTSFP